MWNTLQSISLCVKFFIEYISVCGILYRVYLYVWNSLQSISLCVEFFIEYISVCGILYRVDLCVWNCECIVLSHNMYSYQKEYYNNKHSTVKILCNYSSLLAKEMLWNIQHNNFPHVIIIFPMVIILFPHTVIKFDTV